jgi:O-glycosyl hydrolase
LYDNSQITLHELSFKMPYSWTNLLPAGVAFALSAVAHNKISIQTNTKFQIIDGFGCSEAFWQAFTMRNLPQALSEKSVKLLFHQTEGAGLTILRNRIGSSLSDTILPDNPGGPTETPSYVWNEDDAGQVRQELQYYAD